MIKSANFERSLRSQNFTLELTLYFSKEKRKLNDNLIDEDDNNDYLTKELEFDIEDKGAEYVTRDIGFDI
ncbi:hypothetical protein RclHR1_01980020 [Rhizophagus clarus]|uniref:Uncharacterized protein n=1 Tax=Rhizophagus clarus TaxID=94130 RepID=A0A2Z6QRU5_9GLOM|nr:hypothetical protein RclHR1_01980020 [Rhizophagus clarus]